MELWLLDVPDKYALYNNNNNNDNNKAFFSLGEVSFIYQMMQLYPIVEWYVLYQSKKVWTQSWPTVQTSNLLLLEDRLLHLHELWHRCVLKSEIVIYIFV